MSAPFLSPFSSKLKPKCGLQDADVRRMAYVGNLGLSRDAFGNLSGPWGTAPPAGFPFEEDGLVIWQGLSAADKYLLNFSPPFATHRLPPRVVAVNSRTTVVLTNLVGPSSDFRVIPTSPDPSHLQSNSHGTRGIESRRRRWMPPCGLVPAWFNCPQRDYILLGPPSRSLDCPRGHIKSAYADMRETR